MQRGKPVRTPHTTTKRGEARKAEEECCLRTLSSVSVSVCHSSSDAVPTDGQGRKNGSHDRSVRTGVLISGAAMAGASGVSLLTLPLCCRCRLFVRRLQRGNNLRSSVGVHGVGCVGTGTPALLLATLLSWHVWHHLRRTFHSTLEFPCMCLFLLPLPL
jgi:hypothetical protein